MRLLIQEENLGREFVDTAGGSHVQSRIEIGFQFQQIYQALMFESSVPKAEGFARQTGFAKSAAREPINRPSREARRLPAF
jgi:hypothetical protein